MTETMMERRKTGAGSPWGVEDWKRTMRALGRQIDDPEALAQAMEIRAEMDKVIREAVTRMREVDGYSYTDLARPLGVSRQAARQSWWGREETTDLSS